jgi:uncharacterized protein YxjI
MSAYPLTLRFKVLALARQFSVEDNAGRLLMYIKQQAFKLREAITVYADEGQTRPLYRIQADRVIDFSANYHITDEAGNSLGAVRQRGMRSIWRARFDIIRDDRVVFEVQESNPWAKVGDSFFGEIPVLSFFTGYLFHPKYSVRRAGGGEVLTMTKQPAFFEGIFKMERVDTPLPAEDERLLVIGSAMVILLEKNRG